MSRLPGRRRVRGEKVIRFEDLRDGETILGDGTRVFKGDIDGEGFAAWCRALDGGPETIDHLERVNDLGRLFDDVPDFMRGDPSDLEVTPGRLERRRRADSERWILVKIGPLFRAPDRRYYSTIYGVASTDERAEELHWISGLATVNIETARHVYTFEGHPVIPVLDRWGHAIE